MGKKHHAHEFIIFVCIVTILSSSLFNEDTGKASCRSKKVDVR